MPNFILNLSLPRKANLISHFTLTADVSPDAAGKFVSKLNQLTKNKKECQKRLYQTLLKAHNAQTNFLIFLAIKGCIYVEFTICILRENA